MKKTLIAFLFVTCIIIPIQSIGAVPYGSISVGADAGFLSADSIPEYAYGFSISFRLGGDITDSISLYGKVEAGFMLPIMALHRFLELPGLFSYGIGGGAVFRMGRWALSVDAGVRSLLVSGQQSFYYGGTFTPSYMLLTMREADMYYRKSPYPMGIMISFPISAYACPSGLDLRGGVAVTIDICSSWTRRKI